MCGRFDFHTPVNVIARRYFDLPEAGLADIAPCYNVPPGVGIAVACSDGASGVRFSALKWGYHPSWAGEDAPTPINARAEKVAQSPFFREAFAPRRCLVPANGWFEWQKTEQGKQPFYITCLDHTEEDALFFAAIMDDRPEPGVAILTEPAAAHLTHIHPRQPVVLDPACRYDWLDQRITERAAIKSATRRFPVERLVYRPVSEEVNRPANDYEGLLHSS